MKILDFFGTLIGGLIGVLVYVLGGIDMLLESLIWLSVCDFILGLLCGMATENLSSKKTYKGLAKKVGIYVLIAASNFAGKALGIDELRGIFIGAFVVNELVSIVENAAILGFPVPKKVKAVLKTLKQDDYKK